MATGIAARKFNVDEFHKLAEVGILGEDDRVELLDGQIMVMAPIGENHRGVVDVLTEFFTDQRNGRYRVGVQNPVRIDDEDEPQPDLVLYDRAVTGRHPTPRDIFLIVEVADASLDYDQGSKIPIYAAAEIGEIWIINLTRKCIQRYREPNPVDRRYEATSLFDRSAWVSPSKFPDLRIRLGDLVP